MLVELGIALVAGLFVMLLTSSLMRELGYGTVGLPFDLILVAQFVALAAVAYAMMVASFITFWPAVFMVSLCITIRLIAVAFFQIQGKRAINGSMGKETQWAAELVREEDEEFMRAMRSLDQDTIRRIGIVAESKGELRELTIEESDDQNA